jgi:hypothetical protein
VLSAVALLATAALTVVAVSTGAAPESTAAPAAHADRPSPTSRPPVSRAAGQPHCLIGSWRVTSEVEVFAFYNGTTPQPFTASGTRTFVFRLDGTVTNQNAYTLTGTYQGRELRVEVTGTRVFEWALSGDQITYGALTRTNQVYRYYDQGSLVETLTDRPDPAYHEVAVNRCTGTTVEESNAKGSRSTWARTADHGVYG